MNQSIMSIRGFARATEYACLMYFAWSAHETPNCLSGGFVW